MTTVLRIESSIRTAHSVSRALTSEFMAEWRRLQPARRFIERDLALNPAPHLSERATDAVFTPPHQGSGLQSLDAALADELLQDLAMGDDRSRQAITNSRAAIAGLRAAWS